MNLLHNPALIKSSGSATVWWLAILCAWVLVFIHGYVIFISGFYVWCGVCWEQRRRSRINEKLKALQNLIPNSNKVHWFLLQCLISVLHDSLFFDCGGLLFGRLIRLRCLMKLLNTLNSFSSKYRSVSLSVSFIIIPIPFRGVIYSWTFFLRLQLHEVTNHE